MKHIKTPVAVTVYGNIKDKANELVFETRGPNWTKVGQEAVVALNYHDRMVDICDRLVKAERIANEQEDFTALVNVTEDARDLLEEMEATE